MFKFLLAAVAAAMGFVILRAILTRAGVLRQSKRRGDMSQLRRELDLLLWIPPVLIVLGAIYALVAMLTRGP